MAAQHYEEYDGVDQQFSTQVQYIIDHSAKRAVLQNEVEEVLARDLLAVAQEHMLNTPGTQAMMDYFVDYTNEIAPELLAEAKGKWKR